MSAVMAVSPSATPPLYMSPCPLLSSIISLSFSILLASPVLAAGAGSAGTEWPCTSRSSIQWVGHPRDCARYFICHFGQPVLMPGCPFRQVWGTKVRNCVPARSRWDDCSGRQQFGNATRGMAEHRGVTHRQRDVRHRPLSASSPPPSLLVPIPTSVGKESPRQTSLPTPPARLSKHQAPTAAAVSIATSPPKRKPAPRKAQPTSRKQGHTIRSRPTRNPFKDLQKNAWFQTASSPFQPKHSKKYHTYPRRNRQEVTSKPRRNPIRSPWPGKDPQHARPPTKTPVVIRQIITSGPRRTHSVPSYPSTKITPTKALTQLQKKNPYRPTKMTQVREKTPFKPSKIPSQLRQKTSIELPTQLVKKTAPPSTRTPTKVPSNPKPKQPKNPRWIPRPRQLPKLVQPTQAPRRKDGPKPTPRPSRPVPRVNDPHPKPTPKSAPRTQGTRALNPYLLDTTPTAPFPTTALAFPRPSPHRPRVSQVESTVNPLPRVIPTNTGQRKSWGEGDKELGLRTVPPADRAVKPTSMHLPPGHPCGGRLGKLVSHPTQCHWYYNCTLAALGRRGGEDPSWLEEECRYPQLFDSSTGRCREFINVQCQKRFEPVDPCEYRALQCRKGSCQPCHTRFGACRGRANGIYPLHSSRWTPTFVTCYQQRNIAQDDCQAPTPIFSPQARDCVALSEVPKENGGLRPECVYRQDGFYPDEQGRCGIFFECQNRKFVRYDECPLGTVFDPLTVRCQRLHLSTPPCGEGPAPSCANRPDGFHADPFGRCPYYFECRGHAFIQHHTCDFGSFDPLSQECVIPAEQMPRPCGLLPNPCEDKPSGFYPDESSGCRRYLECFRGVLVTRAACPEGGLFSSASGRCDTPDKAPASCRVEASCAGRGDGRYPAPQSGCGFYLQCRAGRVLGVRQCRVEEGGWYFNARTGRCDYPHNVCPPCGYRWWGCARTPQQPAPRDSRRRELSTNVTITT